MSEEEGESGVQAQETISKPPLNILFNPNVVARKNVWDIDIAALLERLISILDATGNRDLRLCGVAALSSAMILRLKVESIFALEKIAMQRKSVADRSLVENLEVLEMPYRYEATYPVSLEDLLSILENMLVQIANPRHKRQLKLEPVEPPDFDKYLVTFEQLLEEYKEKFLQKIKYVRILLFGDFVKDMKPIEIARYFVGMLYLAMQNEVDLEQTEDDIRVILKSG